MAGFSTFSIAISGMSAAQAGLYVTGHNMANTDTLGYVRQQTVQQDFLYSTIGSNPGGLMQVGLGTDIAAIRQIRDKFLDISYRSQSGRNDFYAVKAQTGMQIESIIGELQSQYTTDSVLKDLWNSFQALSFDTQGVADRGTLVSTAITFVDKVNNIYNRLYDYQKNLDDQVKSAVQRVNQLVTDIDKYNGLITINEISGDNANDYRDSRNACLDELSHLINITYAEKPGGRIDIIAEGNELLVNGVVNKLGLRYTSVDYSFVEPVFTNSADILNFGTKAQPLFSLTGVISATAGSDSGLLKGLLVSRGIHPANYTTLANENAPVAADYAAGTADPQYIIDKYAYDNRKPQPPDATDLVKYPGGITDPDYLKAKATYDQEIAREIFNVNSCFIPKVQRELDVLMHQIISMVNDVMAPYYNDSGVLKMSPDSPYDLNLDNDKGFEIFVRKNVSRYDQNGNYNMEDPSDYHSLYTIGNIMINPLLLNADGYNLIPLQTYTGSGSATDGVSDNTLVINTILNKWKEKIIAYGNEDPLNIDDAYRRFINSIATETSESINFVEEQTLLLQQIDNKRQAISGVSLDEEMKKMMVYQHAYNASARVLNTVDTMIDKLVNGTGRVGR